MPGEILINRQRYPNHPHGVLPRTDPSRSSPALVGAASNGGQPDAPVNNAPLGGRGRPIDGGRLPQTAHAGQRESDTIPVCECVGHTAGCRCLEGSTMGIGWWRAAVDTVPESVVSIIFPDSLLPLAFIRASTKYICTYTPLFTFPRWCRTQSSSAQDKTQDATDHAERDGACVGNRGRTGGRTLVVGEAENWGRII
ncbi:hypothetical protein BJX96DRAFT_144381 [Aspergillus floccosus]